MNLFDDQTQIEFCNSFLIFLLLVSIFFGMFVPSTLFSLALLLVQVGRWIVLKRNGSPVERPVRKMNDEELRKWIV